jgi:hypothetical protein
MASNLCHLFVFCSFSQSTSFLMPLLRTIVLDDCIKDHLVSSCNSAVGQANCAPDLCCWQATISLLAKWLSSPSTPNQWQK